MAACSKFSRKSGRAEDQRQKTLHSKHITYTFLLHQYNDVISRTMKYKLNIIYTRRESNGGEIIIMHRQMNHASCAVVTTESRRGVVSCGILERL